MKRIVIFLALVLSFFGAKSQGTYTPTGTGFGNWFNGIKVNDAFAVPTGSTPTFNGRPSYHGSLFYTTGATPTPYIYDSVHHAWVPIAGGGGGSNLVDTTRILYDTIPIFNLTPSGSSLPAQFNGTATYSVTGGAIVFTNLSGGFSDYIQYDTATMAENFVMTAVIRADENVGPFDGVGIGMRSLNTLGSNSTLAAQYTFNHSGFVSDTMFSQFGHLCLVGAQAGSGSGVGSSDVVNTNINLNDILYYTFSRYGNTYYFSVQNKTQGWLLQWSFPCTTTGLPAFPSNTSNPAIFDLGGLYSVLQWTYSILKPHRLDFAILGNSITMGQGSSIQSADWANNIGDITHNVIRGGGGDYTASLLIQLPEIKKLNPPYAITMMGGNDIMAGVSTSTWQANLRTYHDALVAQGTQVIWAYPSPRNPADMRPLVAFLDTAADFSHDLKIRGTFYALRDTTEFGLDSVYNSGDGVHPNDLGHQYISYIVNDSLIQWGLYTPQLKLRNINALVSRKGTELGQSIYGGYTQHGTLGLFGSSYSDGGVVNIQDNIFALKTNTGIATQFPQAPLDINGELRVGANYPVSGNQLARSFGSITGGNIGINYLGLTPAGYQSNENVAIINTGEGVDGYNPLFLYYSDLGYKRLSPSAHNFITYMDPTTHVTKMFTILGNGLTTVGGDISIGGYLGNYLQYWDMTNNRIGIGGSTGVAGYDLASGGLMYEGGTIPANSNDNTVATTSWTNNNAGGVVSGADFFNATSGPLNLVNYSPTAAKLFYTAELGPAISVNSFTGSPTITVTATWENAQTAATDTYTWPVTTVTANGYIALNPIIINHFHVNPVTLTLTIGGTGTIAFNASGVYKQIR